MDDKNIEDNSNSNNNDEKIDPSDVSEEKKEGNQKIKTSVQIDARLVKKLKKRRGEGADAQKVIKRIKDFDQETSPACRKIHSRFGRGIIHEELKSLAEFICEKVHIELDRDAKRDNRVLHKWFQENWEVIEPVIDQIELFDKDHQLIQ